MENFGRKIKKMITAGFFVGAATTGFGKESAKSVDVLTPETKKITAEAVTPEQKDLHAIDYQDAQNLDLDSNNMEPELSLKQQFENAQKDLVKTQLEFSGAHKKIADRLAFDKIASQQIAEIADYPAQIAVMVKALLNGADVEDLKNPENIQKYIAKALEVSKDSRSNLANNQKALESLSEGLLHSLVHQEGISEGGKGDAVVNKDQTERAFWAGEDNIIDRLITATVQKQALEKINSATQDISPNSGQDLFVAQ